MMSGARRGTSSRIGDDAVAPKRLDRELGKAVVAAGEADELADPADGRDLRLVPLLEVDARPAGQRRRGASHLVEAGLQLLGQRRRLRLAADHPAEHAHRPQDLGDAAVVEDVHLAAGTHQLGGDVRLQVRETEHQIRLQRQDPVDLRAGEGRHARLLAPRPRRAHGEAGNADDPPVLPQQVQGLGRLLGEADDARGVRGRAVACHGWAAL
jgi:hypothetical protein